MERHLAYWHLANNILTADIKPMTFDQQHWPITFYWSILVSWHWADDIRLMTFGQWHLAYDIWPMAFGRWHLAGWHLANGYLANLPLVDILIDCVINFLFRFDQILVGQTVFDQMASFFFSFKQKCIILKMFEAVLIKCRNS